MTDALRRVSLDMFGERGPATNDERSKLYRKVAGQLRRTLGCKVTTAQVRTVAQRIRNTPETRTGFPVDLTAEAYALLAQQREKTSETMKALATAAIMAVYGGDQIGGW